MSRKTKRAAQTNNDAGSSSTRRISKRQKKKIETQKTQSKMMANKIEMAMTIKFEVEAQLSFVPVHHEV